MSMHGGIPVATTILEFWKWLWMEAVCLCMIVENVTAIESSRRTRVDGESYAGHVRICFIS